MLWLCIPKSVQMEVTYIIPVPLRIVWFIPKFSFPAEPDIAQYVSRSIPKRSPHHCRS